MLYSDDVYLVESRAAIRRIRDAGYDQPAMADLLDRLAQPHIFGGAHFSLDHVDSTRAASVIEGSRRDYPGTSISPPPEQEFDAWYSQIMYPGIQPTHASTQSETDSEGHSATSPSGLTAGSSVGTSEDADEDVAMTEAPTPERHHEDIWPQVSNVDIPPRDPTIHDNDDPLHLAEDQMLLSHSKLPAQSLDPKAQGSPTPSVTRARKLPSPEKTGKVRGMGACLHCRVAKTSCAATHGPCDGCQKSNEKWQGPGAHEMCIRKTPHDVVGSLASRWCLDTGSPSPRFGNQDVPILISFTGDASGPFLKIRARELEGQQGYGIDLDQNPLLEKDMFQWAKERIESDLDSSFEPSLDRFLVSLVRHRGIDRASNGDVRSSFVDSQKECVQRLLKMKSMWRIWSCKELYFRQHPTQPGSMMSSCASLQPVQDFLRNLAGAAVSEAEKAVLNEVDKLLAPISIKRKEQRILWSALNAVEWTSLWQLMLIYRSTLRMFHEEQIGRTPTNTGFHSAKRTEFLAITGELYKKVAVLCSGAFRTNEVLSSLAEGGSEVLANEPFRFSEVWKAHHAFYQSFEVVSPGDELVNSMIVAKEGKVLGRKRPSKK